jgi:hypothetical protein
VADNVTFQTTAATPASGTKVVADQVTYSGDASSYLQIVRTVAVTGAEGSKTVVELYGTRSDNFTTASNGTAIDASTRPMRTFALQVTGTIATATSWTVVLEGSLDGTTFTTLLTHDSTTHADGATAWGDAVDCPVLYFRSRCTAISLGSATNVVAVILGVP